MNLNKDDKREAVKFIIENYDRFENIKLDLPKIIKNIITTIDDFEFNLNDYNQILSVMANHVFDEVKLFIYKKNKYYKECLDLYLNEDAQLKDKRNTLFPFINMTLTQLKLRRGQDQEVFEDFKKAVMNNLIKIAEIDINELYSLINTWYSKEKNEVINKLSTKPEIELKYVELIVKNFISFLGENEGSLEEDPTWVENILILHIKLLCYVKKKDQVLPSLKACPLYPLNESLEICLRCEVYDAVIYLYQKAGYIDKALNVCLKIFVDAYNKIMENLCANEFSENTHELQRIEFEKIYNKSVEILEENEKALSDDHNTWFSLLDIIYKFVEAFPIQKTSIPQGREKFGDEIEILISEKFKHLLEKMSSYVGVNKILDVVCKKQIEFKEFKPLLLKMLASFGNQTHLLNCLRDYLIHTCLEDQGKLQNMNIKGKKIDFNDCDVCLKDFNKTIKDKEKIIIFNCNHMEHEDCTLKEPTAAGDKVCTICLKKEIEDSITCSKDDPKSSIKLKDYMRNNNDLNRNANRQKANLNIFSYKPGFARMNRIDKYNKEKKNMFYYDSANSCRDKYRKVVFDD